MSFVPELLAPAGSPGALKAAVAAGANAVYLGGKAFGARRYAANFDQGELSQAVLYAHRNGVKVYVTVNTLATDDELLGIAEYLIFLSEIGVDAILVQDQGMLSIAREVAPDLTLHASTQMTIHNTAGIRFAAEHGISRVVLARELSLEDVAGIGEVAKGYGIELEVFCHGAICYAYSGQCLLSSVIGGRSGNRGMCAQPCRKPYTLLIDGDIVPTQGNYPLSPRDLCLYPYLKELCAAPIAALKIEGRMKTPEYVAVVTDAYRRALDAIAADINFKPEQETMEDLACAFNRGFTKGYLMGDCNTTLINTKKPENRGVYAGVVNGVDNQRGKVIVKIGGPIPEIGDGIVFRLACREIGFALNKEPYLFPKGDAYKIPAPREVLVGSELWITRRMKTERKATAILSRRVQGKIQLDITVGVNESGCLAIIGHGAVAVSKAPMQNAQTHPVTTKSLEAQLRKTGGTPFVIRSIIMNYDGAKFLPMGTINDLRRRFLAVCSDVVTSPPVRMHQPFVPKKTGIPEKTELVIQVYTDSIIAAKTAHTAGAGQVVYEGTDEVYDTPIIYKLPRILHEEELANTLSKLPGTAAGIMVDGAGIAEEIKDIPKYGGSGLNITNARTAIVYGKTCRQVCLSPELSRKQIKSLMEHLAAYPHPPKTEIIVQGNLEVMITQNCIPATALGCRSCNHSWALKDGTGRVFRVRTDANCCSHILNAVEICLIEHIKTIANAGVSVISIDARGRSPEYVRRMVSLYTAALEGGNVKELKNQIKEIASGGVTAAHYLRGVETF